jgi:hypothetical protein
MVELRPITGTDYFLWKYLPSIPLAAAFLCAFLIVTTIHVTFTIRTKTHFSTYA